MIENNTTSGANNNITSEASEIIQDNTIENTKPINSRYNIQNLKPFNPKYNNHLTTEEAQKRGRNGGKKSGEVRRQKKTMRETLESALSIELSPEKLQELGAATELMTSGENTVLSAIVAAALREAINGDSKSLQIIRDTIGEKPIEKTADLTEIITHDDLTLINNLKDSLIG